MKKLILSFILLLFLHYSNAQIFAVVYGVDNQYTQSFCKELTENKIPWSFCDILGKDSTCLKEMRIVVNKYHLSWYGNTFLPIVKLTSYGQEYGFCVSCERKDIIKKMTTITEINTSRQAKINVTNDIILNPLQQQIQIYLISGSLLLSSNNKEINITQLNPGLYIIKSKNLSLKYVKIN